MAEARPPPSLDDVDRGDVAEPDAGRASRESSREGDSAARRVIHRVVVERLNGRSRGQKLEFVDPERIGFGRHPGNDVAFDARRDLDASSRHAELCWRDGALVLRDVGSSNGTLVDGQRITEMPVESGDPIAVEFGVGGPRVRIALDAADGLARAVARPAGESLPGPTSPGDDVIRPPSMPHVGTDHETDHETDHGTDHGRTTGSNTGGEVSRGESRVSSEPDPGDQVDGSVMYARVGAGFGLIFVIAAVAVVIAAAIAWISLV